MYNTLLRSLAVQAILVKYCAEGWELIAPVKF
jgi:hypothetical protein